MSNYSNAFTEVYEILNSLEEEEYKKIPVSLIEIIEENRNKEYEYILDDSLELSEHPMLKETKAILFNIFRDYLSTTEQKSKIIRMQAEERRKNEEIKTDNYYKDKNIEEKAIQAKVEIPKECLELLPISDKVSFWEIVKRKIKSIFLLTSKSNDN